MNKKRIRVPDLDVKLTLDEIAVTQTPTFQRLFNIKQLGLAYLVYPGATHTRGMHSIYTLHEADKMITAVRLNEADLQDAPPTLNQVEEQEVRMASLLHDLGHIPFSHMLEDENQVLPKHDEKRQVSKAFDLLEKELGSQQGAIELVRRAEEILLRMNDPKLPGHGWQTDLIGNTVCADLLAYISADAMWTGIEKRPGAYRIYDYLVRSGDRLCVKLTKGALRNDVVSCITDILDMRYALVERVLNHHAKAVASSMLARAASIAELGKVPRATLLEFGDERFLQFLAERLRSRGARESIKLVEGLRSRRLYKRIFRAGVTAREARDQGLRDQDTFCARFRDPNVVTTTLDKVETEHSLDRGSLVLWCPAKETSMKLAETQVIWDWGGSIEGPEELRGKKVQQRFPGVHARVKAIEDQYLDLWTVWVSMDPKYLDKTAVVVKTLEQELGMNCDALFKQEVLDKLKHYRTVEAWYTAVSHEVRPVVTETSMGLAFTQTRHPTQDRPAEPAQSREILETVETNIDRMLDGKREKETSTGHPTDDSKNGLSSSEGAVGKPKGRKRAPVQKELVGDENK